MLQELGRDLLHVSAFRRVLTIGMPFVIMFGYATFVSLGWSIAMALQQTSPSLDRAPDKLSHLWRRRLEIHRKTVFNEGFGTGRSD